MNMFIWLSTTVNKVTGDKLGKWDVISSRGGICSFPLPGWLCNPSSLLSIVFQWPFVWRSSVQTACNYQVSRSRNRRYEHFNCDVSWYSSASHSVIHCMLNGWGWVTNRVEFFCFCPHCDWIWSLHSLLHNGCYEPLSDFDEL